MQRIDGDIVIHRPVDEVFDFVADERNEPQYNPQMRRVTQTSRGPIGVGTRFHCEMGRGADLAWEVVAYERPHRLGGAGRATMRLLGAVPTMDIQGTLTFDPVPEGTRMHWSWQMAPCGVLKVVTPLVGRIGQRQETRIWASLKHLLETAAPPPHLDGAMPL